MFDRCSRRLAKKCGGGGGDVRHVHDMFGVDRVDLVGVTCGMYTICLEWIEWTW